jgi:predicted RNase H-like HicB family nuclease
MSSAASTNQSTDRFMRAAQRYPIIVKQAGSNWSAFAPDLLGCVAAADTQAETEQLMREAIAFHLEALEDDAESWPQPGSSSSAS